jgi:hypothetical protein
MWWQKTEVNRKGLPLKDEIDWTKATEYKNKNLDHLGRSWGVAYWIEGQDVGMLEFLLENSSGRRHGFEALAYHRLDGPAFVSSSLTNTKEWWQYGVRHRSDGPAVIGLGHHDYYSPVGPAKETDWKNPSFWIEQEWIVHGKRHRLDGPAVISRRCSVYEFFINNELVEPSAIYDDEEEIEAHLKTRQRTRSYPSSVISPHDSAISALTQGLPSNMAKTSVPLNHFT